MIALMLWLSFLWPARSQVPTDVPVPPQPQQPTWKGWGETVEKRLLDRFTENQTINAEIQSIRTELQAQKKLHASLAEAIEKLKETPDVVKENAQEIKTAQADLKTAVDEVKAKQDEPAPKGLPEWALNIINSLAGIGALIITTFMARLLANTNKQLAEKTIVHVQDQNGKTIPPTQIELPK